MFKKINFLVFILCFFAPHVFADPIIEFSGLVEVEGNIVNNYHDNCSSDAALATVELGVNAALKSNVSAEIIVLYENKAPIALDVASIMFDNIRNYPLNFIAGQFYIPFGQYNSAFISDSLTLEIGENRENALQLGLKLNQLSVAAYLFRSDALAGDNIQSFGVNFYYRDKKIDFGVNYISNIMGTHLVDKVSNSSVISAPIGGIAIYANTMLLGISIGGEFLTTVERVREQDLKKSGDDVQPSAYNIELGYGFSSKHHMALGVQGTTKSQVLELPKKRFLLGYTLMINDETSLGIEWLYDMDYSISNGGTGNNQNFAIMQLAASF